MMMSLRKGELLLPAGLQFPEKGKMKNPPGKSDPTLPPGHHHPGEEMREKNRTKSVIFYTLKREK
jgi:hypothetical protein